MAANVESMFYVREKPWHGLGTMVQESLTSADALRVSGLDWTVNQQEILSESGVKIPGYRANVRSSDGAVLGVVSDRYKVVNNVDAFSFTDSLIGGEVHYETAGSLAGGKRIWLLAQIPGVKILGDETENYLCFSNSHDGTGAIKVCITPIRVVCQNTLNLALKNAKRSWSIKHTGDIESKIHDAQVCLGLAKDYAEEFSDFAEVLSKKNISDEKIKEILKEMFPITDDMSEREAKNAKKAYDEFMVCYFAPDLQKFRGTAWGAINAMSDFATHTAPKRQSKTYRENNWGRVINGHPMIDKMVSILCAMK